MNTNIHKYVYIYLHTYIYTHTGYGIGQVDSLLPEHIQIQREDIIQYTSRVYKH